jgi:hypothetical protein
MPALFGASPWRVAAVVLIVAGFLWAAAAHLVGPNASPVAISSKPSSRHGPIVIAGYEAGSAARRPADLDDDRPGARIYHGEKV